MISPSAVPVHMLAQLSDKQMSISTVSCLRRRALMELKPFTGLTVRYSEMSLMAWLAKLISCHLLLLTWDLTRSLLMQSLRLVFRHTLNCLTKAAFFYVAFSSIWTLTAHQPGIQNSPSTPKLSDASHPNQQHWPY